MGLICGGRTVIRRVLDGGVGRESAGRSERSRDMFGLWRRLMPEVDDEDEEERETGGVETSVAMVDVQRPC